MTCEGCRKIWYNRAMQQEEHPGLGLDLFGNPADDPFERLLQALRKMADDVVREWNLPQRGVVVAPNYGVKGKSNEGKIVSYSVSISEPDYPATEEDSSDEKRVNNPCVTFKQSSAKTRLGFIEVTLRAAILDRIGVPKVVVGKAIYEGRVDLARCLQNV